jgi:type II secretory pathway pseudopilin PulG
MGQKQATRNSRGAVGSRPSGFVIRHSGFGFSSRQGYLLLELILALTIFSLAIVGLVRSLQVGIQTAAILNRENDVRIGLRSFLEEVRRKPLSEMATSVDDARLGVTFNSELDELTVKDRNGSILKDLYKLHAFANYTIGAEERSESVEMWIYKTQTEGRK